MNEITIPQKIEPIIKAFFADSPTTAKGFIIQAAKAIYSYDQDDDIGSYKKTHILSTEELEGVCCLVRGIKPQDMLEALLAAQIVVGHLIGLRRLANRYSEDQRFGLKMLKFSNDAINRLQ
jgi:hypothetical protein